MCKIELYVAVQLLSDTMRATEPCVVSDELDSWHVLDGFLPATTANECKVQPFDGTVLCKIAIDARLPVVFFGQHPRVAVLRELRGASPPHAGFGTPFRTARVC